MIQITIYDDDFQMCSQLEDYARRWKEGRRLEVEIFNTGKEFEEAPKERYYNLIFLDIVMRDRSGIELDRLIREKLSSDVNVIVYMSTYGDEYTLDLFQSQPFHFLKKPIRPENFQDVFYKACEKIEDDAGISKFESSRTVYKIPLKDILYFEGDNRRVKIVTTGHTYHCCSTSESLLSKINMEQAGLMRLYKPYAVNLRYVAISSACMATLFDGSEFAVSASSRENMLRRCEGHIPKTEIGPGDRSGE